MSDDIVHPLLKDCDSALRSLHEAMCSLLGGLRAPGASEEELMDAKKHLCKHFSVLLYNTSCVQPPRLTLECLPPWALERLGIQPSADKEDKPSTP